MKLPATLIRVKKTVEGMGFTTIVQEADPSVSLVGYRADLRVGFQAFWPDGKWGGALVRDPLGIPQELWGDYAAKASGSKRPSAREVERGQELSATYNTGASWLNRKALLRKANDFYAWVDDWQLLLLKKGNYKPLARQAK